MGNILALFGWIGGHATKILGFLTVTVSYLNAEGIIPKGQLKYYTIVLGLFTVWRGFFTGNAYTKGLADGAAPRAMAIGLGGKINLTPSQPEKKLP
jgi:hypothetical protein